MDSVKLLGFAGSLRKGSYNRALLHAAIEAAPPEVSVMTTEIGDIPLYNTDLDTDSPPNPVRRFKEQIASADGLLIATPEYNYSIPGGLKNALDWASRPAASSVLKGKPIGIMGASGGRFGTVRAQLALRQVFLFTESHVMLKPEMLLPNATQYFDDDGTLDDDDTRERLVRYMSALANWTRRMRVESDKH